MAVYDCTQKPNPTDKASTARIKYLTFKEYLSAFEFLWETFSKESVMKGGLEKLVQSVTYKKGITTVDKDFLLSLDRWRTYLATSISSNNKELAEDEINFVVQQTLDHILFLRMAEGRGVERYGRLLEAIQQGEYYNNLFCQFEQADKKYNSCLFYFIFKKIKSVKKIQVDNKVIQTIIRELYYPDSPYEFSVLPVEILGSAYEEFLGKTITLDKAHRAKVQEKRESEKPAAYTTPHNI